MRTPFTAALLTGAVLLCPAAHAMSIAGNVSCSGELSISSDTYGHLSCAGNFSLSDAVVTDPIKLVLEASGSLTLLRSTLEAPEIVLVAPHIDVRAQSILLLPGRAVYIGAVMPQSASPTQPAPSTVSGPLPTLPLNGVSGGTLTLSVGGSLPDPGVSHQGGSLQLGRDSDALVAISQNSSGAAVPPLLIASTVPEPSAALLLTAGLGLIALRRNMSTCRR
ncbi:MAG: PEP-CTERM sorting domain-containing protein [Methyloversatilis discipulorum]|uniref:PEP-CTERM sorting domain-containing protein n=1 Tax=Methyloversatilis discipulorum TaxID=1119528 RepID=UPI0026EB3180|nr:PEP-CTERM sorting domain-containing protein [Methyloversatilis discipulorum]MBV5284905.1 PEP-CTERM sorting domain-containing protein [Methyloversatilis discipulorum]